jgi:dipeptidase E
VFYMKRILAIGGGGFQMETEPSPIDDYILQLTGKHRPRLCLVSTPSGDLPDYIERFYAAFSQRSCEPSHLAFFFRDIRPGAVALKDLAKHLLAQDAIFVSGGNTRAALSVWREWGVDRVFAEALNAGVLLSGMSAGAMCWFEFGLTDTYWEPGYRPSPCLGFLPGGCRVHYNDAHGRERLHAATEAGAVPTTIAIDDYSAVLFRDATVEKVMSWRSGSSAYRVSREDGHAQDVAYSYEWIGSA